MFNGPDLHFLESTRNALTHCADCVYVRSKLMFLSLSRLLLQITITVSYVTTE
jgi:hypothetical protein